MTAGLQSSLAQLQRRVLAGREEQARAFVMGSRLVGGTGLSLRFQPARPIEVVRIHVQSTAPGEGGGTYDPAHYTSREDVDCRGSKVQDYDVTLDPAERYYVWVIPLVRDGAGAYSERIDEAEFLDMAPEGDALWETVGTAASTMAAHLAAPDPHPQYLTPAEGSAAYDALGAAATATTTAAAALASHEADTTAIHGIANTANLVLTSDTRLSDARTPTAHAATHAPSGSDPLDAYYRALADGDFPGGISSTGTVDFSSASFMAIPSSVEVGGPLVWTGGSTAFITGLPSGAGNVTNLDADKLDGQHGSYHLDRAHHTGTQAIGTITGIVPLAQGGTNADNSSQSANTVFAGPSSGGAGAMSIRALVAADIPLIGAAKVTPGTFDSADTDITSALGRVKLSSPLADSANFSHFDFATTTGYALRQTNTGATIINTPTGGTISFAFQSAVIWQIDGSGHLVPTGTRNVTISGALKHTGTTAGFFNTAATTKQTVTGAKGGNAALASLLTALAAYGLITDSST